MDILVWKDQNVSYSKSFADQHDIMLERLRNQYDFFRDLANITSYDDIKYDVLTTERLQDAYNIMYAKPGARFIEHNGKKYKLRCKPCEMEALCAIKQVSRENDMHQDIIFEATRLQSMKARFSKAMGDGV